MIEYDVILIGGGSPGEHCVGTLAWVFVSEWRALPDAKGAVTRR